MKLPGINSGLLAQLAASGLRDRLTGVVEETAGQRLHASEGFLAPLHEQDTQPPLTQRQDYKVNCEQNGRRRPGIITHGADRIGLLSH
ncbi:hypothetical protein GCM10009574_083780 [Streptomyces asiaticus]